MISGLYVNALQQPHLLIAGTTGSGKSTVIQALLHAIACASAIPESEIWLCDPKKVELYRWTKSPYCGKYADEPEATRHLLQTACEKMDARYTRMRNQGLTLSAEKDIYIVVDELADLLLASDRHIAKDTEKYLSRLAQLGRAAKIHLIVATQFVRRSVLPESLIANITSVIGLRTRDSLESRMIIGQAGCESLPRYGQCYYFTPDLGKPYLQNIEKVEDERIDRASKAWFEKSA